ncbi:MAG: hypothetical protein L6Q33_11220 [Bacteriovoracaceae bacterium]|nr:hypothetical protein [Bacteriovoracaceae bacterium]
MLKLIKNTVIFTCFTTTLFFSLNVAAKENILLTITNDEDKEVTRFVAETDADDRIIKKFHQDTFDARGKLLKRISAESRNLKNNNGMVLKAQDKYVVVALKCQNFDEQQGGDINIDTLYNGATGERRQYSIELSKDKAAWSVYVKDQKVKSMHLQSNKVMLIGTVGIKNIVMK